MNKQAFRRVAGFTLIEILAVMVIIALLIGLISRFGAYAYRKAQEAEVEKDFGTIKAAAVAYKARYGTFPIYPKDTKSECKGLASGDMSSLVEDMKEALKEETGMDMPTMDPYRSYYKNDRKAAIGYRYYCVDGSAIYVWSHGINGKDEVVEGEEAGDDIGEKPSKYHPYPPDWD